VERINGAASCRAARAPAGAALRSGRSLRLGPGGVLRDKRSAIMSGFDRKFVELCDIASQKSRTEISTRDFEDSFVDVLTHIKNNMKNKNEYVVYFVRLVISEHVPHELISFCMHELRWEEVKDTAICEINKAEDFRVKNVMCDIIEAFSMDWDGKDLYAYYKKPQSNHP
jgi:hypothetical protein